MRTWLVLLLATPALLAGTPRPADAGQTATRLELQFEADGTVTLYALNVGVSDILAEWARQCGCHVVNAAGLTDRVTVPMQFEHRSQAEVLESLLRRASGYVLTPWREGMTGPSWFETIYVVPTSRVSQTYTPPAPILPSTPLPTSGSPADEIPPVVPISTLPNPAAAGGAPQPPAAPAPRVPGTPTRFVPIVPITSGPASAPSQPPGTPTPAPQTVTPQ